MPDGDTGSRIDWIKAGWKIVPASRPLDSNEPACYVIDDDIDLPGPVRLILNHEMKHGWLILPDMDPEQLAAYLGLSAE